MHLQRNQPKKEMLAQKKKTEDSKPGELQAHEVRAKLEETEAQFTQKRKELEAASKRASDRYSSLAWAVYEYEDGTPEQAAKQKEADHAEAESAATGKQLMAHIMSHQAQMVSVLHVANPAKLEPKFKLRFDGEVQRQGQELESKFDEHYNNLQDVYDSLMKEGEGGKANDIAEKMNDLYKRHQDEMYQLSQKVQGEFTAPITAKWQKGIDAFSKLVGTGTVDGKPLNVKDLSTNERSFFSDRNTAINLTPQSETKTVVHELGHWLEHHDPEVKRKANEFLDRRTQGETPQKLSELTGLHGYDGTEFAKADQFMNPYMGKLYSDKSTELISMGLEHMVSDPLEFARKDPDYFDFIYNTVRGK